MPRRKTDKSAALLEIVANAVHENREVVQQQLTAALKDDACGTLKELN
jgi:hypothetical protein